MLWKGLNNLTRPTDMNHLTAEVVKKSCAFVLQIQDPTETLKKLAMFFLDRDIALDNLQMHRFRNSDAMLIIHSQIEKDSFARTVESLEQLPGVVKLEWLEGK